MDDCSRLHATLADQFFPPNTATTAATSPWSIVTAPAASADGKLGDSASSRAKSACGNFPATTTRQHGAAAAAPAIPTATQRCFDTTAKQDALYGIHAPPATTSPADG